MSEKKSNGGSTIIKDALILFAIALVLSAILGFTNELTKDRIAEQKILQKERAYEEVFPGLEGGSIKNTDELTALVENSTSVLALSSDTNIVEGSTINDILEVDDASGNLIGYVVNVTNSKGYGGDIEMAVGMDKDLKITGLSIISNSETAGLGANCTKETWRAQFNGKTIPITYSKTGATGANEIDAISSSTFTTKAVVWGVNSALYVIQMGLRN
jgi:electron transport complex protein RnfG